MAHYICWSASLYLLNMPDSHDTSLRTCHMRAGFWCMAFSLVLIGLRHRGRSRVSYPQCYEWYWTRMMWILKPVLEKSFAVVLPVPKLLCRTTILILMTAVVMRRHLTALESMSAGFLFLHPVCFRHFWETLLAFPRGHARVEPARGPAVSCKGASLPLAFSWNYKTKKILVLERSKLSDYRR